MSEIQIKQGKIIYQKNTPITTVSKIIEGEVSLELPYGVVKLDKGDVIGLLDLTHTTHSHTYTAVTDVVVDSYPYQYVDSLVQLFTNMPELIESFFKASIKQFIEINDIYSIMRYECDSLYSALMEYYRDYTMLCKRYHLTAKTLPDLEQIKPLVLENEPDIYLSSYYKDMETITNHAYFSELTKNLGYTTGVLMRANEDMQILLDAYQEMAGYMSDLSRLLINEDNMDFLDLYSSLLINVYNKSDDTLTLTAAISKMFIRAKDVSSICEPLFKERLLKYQNLIKKLESQEHTPSEIVSEEAPNIYEELKDSINVILSYAKMEPSFCSKFKENVEVYKNIVDKTVLTDQLISLRKELTEAFYELYRKAFFVSVQNSNIPTILRMFFYTGYVDENLCGIDNANHLYAELCNYKYEKDKQIYPFYEWLRLIYDGQKEPRRDEFDQDYPSFIQNMVTEGKINKSDIPMMLSNNRHKVIFEMHNMFQSTGKMTYGRINTFCPLLSEHDFIKSPQDSMVTAYNVQTILSSILDIDFSAFYRETMFTDSVLSSNYEIIQSEVLPDIILLPNIGTRGVLWQEIEGRNRSTPACMLLPMFCLTDLNILLLRLTGEFRWEMCKRMQGGRWNDVSNLCLTSEYFDYLQFYKKNKELSPENKEKCKMQLQRVKNRFKEAFIIDYLSWVLYESKGSPRLNKVTRNIFMTYCPFTAKYREELKKNPLYLNLIKKYETQKNKELTRMNNITYLIKRNSNKDVPKELEQQIKFLTK